MFGGLLRGREVRQVSEADILRSINDRRMTSSGLSSNVDTDTAMRHSAVWACIRLIAGVGSTFPLDQYRIVGGQQTPMPLAQVLADPSPDVSAVTWRYQLWSSILTAGNAYGLITEFTATGFPRRIELLNPGVVSWHRDGDRWDAKIDNKVIDRWPNGPLWHVPLFAQPGQPFGLSPIGHAAKSINAGLAAEKFGGEFFTAGGHPSAIIYSDQNLTPEQSQGIKSAFVNSTESREPTVFGSALKYEQVQVSPTDSQFLESQRFTVEQIARIYGVFPEMIGAATSGSNVTYANREQRAADWLTYGMVPYLVPIEDAKSTLIPRPQKVKANVSAVLRSDLQSRYESYKIAAEIGDLAGVPLLSVNEMRDFEDLPPVEGGDQFDRQTPSPAVPSPTENP